MNPLIGLILISIPFIKTLAWLGGSWIMNPYYNHGFLVLIVSLYFGYQAYKKTDFQVSTRGVPLIGVGLIAHVAASFYELNFISAIAFLTAVYGLLLTIFKNTKGFIFPLILILIAIPLPIEGIVNTLASMSTVVSGYLLKGIGLNIITTGAELRVKELSFEVGAPCSGIRSILALTTLSLILTHLYRDSIPLRATVFLSAIFLAFVANVLRITTIVLIAFYFSLDWAMNFFHYASDIFLFLVALLMIVVLRRCIIWLKHKLSS